MNSKDKKNIYDERPWGNYEILHAEESSGFQVKRVEVLPGQRLSLQKHSQRSEIWTIAQGEGLVTLNDAEISVSQGSVIEIPVESKHRISNTGTKPLVFIEVQLGSYLGEDDIVRFQDDYDRK